MIKPGKYLGLKGLVVLLLIAFLVPLVPVRAVHKDYEPNELYEIMEEALVWKKSEEKSRGEGLLQEEFLAKAGSSAADWYAFAIGRMGVEDDYFSYLSRLRIHVENSYKEEEQLSDIKATEWHRISLAILSLGGDPTSFGVDQDNKPINLIQDGTYDRPIKAALGAQGMNGFIFGLISLDGFLFKVPSSASLTRGDILQSILENQLDSGSFSLDGNEPAIDLTAMALSALAPYRYLQKPFNIKGKEKTVAMAIEDALTYLSENQSEEGDFSSFGSYNLESSAQVLVALSSLRIDPVNDERFIKNHHNVLDGFMKYLNKEGSFTHNLEEEDSPVDADTSNSMATEQALYGLVSLYRYQTNMRGIYDFRPEMNPSLKEKINALETGITNISSKSYEELDSLKKIYEDIPKSERMFINDLDQFYLALDDLSMTYSPIVLEDYGENTEGPGAVTSLVDFKPLNSVLKFNESDQRILEHLMDNIGVKDEATLTTLFEKLSKAENKEDFPGVLDEIKEMQERVAMRKTKIEKLNQDILDTVYPFENLTKDDDVMVTELLKKINELTEDEKSLVLGYEDLVKTKARIDTGNRSNLFLIGAMVIFLLFLGLLAMQIKKRKKKKKENQMVEEDLDW